MGAGRRSAKRVKVTKKPVRKIERLPWPRMKTEESGKLYRCPKAIKSRGLEKGATVALGVDVREKRQDIVKIVYRYFKVPGYTMEELLQEVFLAICHKNHGRSAHDPTKSSFGHYVYMVANNVCINLVNRSKKFEKERDSIDSTFRDGEGKTVLETHGAPTPEEDPFHARMEEVETILRKEGMWDLARYVRAARSGASSDVIREALSFGGRTVTNKTIRDIRHQVRDAARILAVNSEVRASEPSP